jgi:hypothetical protein
MTDPFEKAEGVGSAKMARSTSDLKEMGIVVLGLP